ncbi:hypothetical protein FFLO_04010 [Filobasidium floriforme]|uniref:WD40 repeat-like protein n=1 Tax=Filobasidium floriforme TaxID=5210 RepID=A0A8K0JLQ5_9TREE|nr:hypothetical protein FFLO_04010 [Filobasidium floriforme]
MTTTPVHPVHRFGNRYGRSFPSKHMEFRTRGPSGSGGARSHRSALLDTPNFWRELDLSQTLGDNETYGHTGCVNALSWSHDGSQLLSGSDDARLCIWEPDENTAPTAQTPHPLRLKESIQTAHRANIFSAKFLPQANHPTIASVAGDSRVMVYDVERLGRTNSVVDELDGRSGSGVKEIMCHTDRVKRISTEDNPHVFLTVSEDGTVRQHDLRTHHRCRTGPRRGTNCPVPLLEAPGGIELYTLSVSKLNPYLFTVAGTSEYAFLQDRRMTRQISQEWSHQVDPESQVQCVRRFGLPPGESGVTRRSRWGSPRHITAVRMSPDVAEGLLEAFSGYGVALYSIHDNPGLGNRPTQDITANHRHRNMTKDTADQPEPSETGAAAIGPSRTQTEQVAVPATSTTIEDDMEVDPVGLGTTAPPAQTAPRQYHLSDFLLDMNQDRLLPPFRSADETVESEVPPEDTPSQSEDEDGSNDDDDDMQADAVGMDGPDQSGWAGVPIVYPRCTYKGARNVETVKDVSFGGARSDKICSGSDDGNWFMWDKATGRLEGIWEGDESVVNVVEQHPSLPIFAVSGIDSTVKVFAPLHGYHGQSKGRLHHADEIIDSNKRPEPSPVGYSMRQFRALIESRLDRQLAGGDENDEEPECRVQ